MSYLDKQGRPYGDLKDLIDDICDCYTGDSGCKDCPLRGVRDPMGEKVCSNYIKDDELAVFKEQILEATGAKEIYYGSKLAEPKPEGMSQADFEKLVSEIRDASLETLIKKNANYAAGADKLHNFRAGGAILGKTPAQVALGYMTKHMVALVDKVERDDFADRDDLLEKCQDIINYVAIIWACGNEGRSA